MYPSSLEALFSSRNWPALRQMSLTGWSFDFFSFIIGVVTTLILIGLIYRNREQLAEVREQLKTRARQLQERLTANMATRYSDHIVEAAESGHLFEASARLQDIFVQAYLDAPLAALDRVEESQALSLEQALQATDRLLILGAQGSGRTTLLYHLLLVRATRIGQTGNKERVPLYTYLPVLASEITRSDQDDSSQAESGTPAQQLAQNALSSMSRMVAAGVSRWLRQQVESGNALILLDGWDEVAAKDRATVTNWIQAIVTAHPGNHFVVTGSDHGYGPLMDLGWVPLRTVAWTPPQFADLTKSWFSTVSSPQGEPDEPLPAITYTLVPPTPLEATIELVLRVRGKAPGRTLGASMKMVMDELVPTPTRDDEGHPAWPIETGWHALERLAFTAMTEDRLTLTRQEIQSTVTEEMPPLRFASDNHQDEPTSQPDTKAERQEQERRTLEIVDCCRALTTGEAPIRAWDGERFFFAHPSMMAYLTACYLVNNDLDVTPYADDSAWSEVLRFYVSLAPAEPVIEHLLTRPDDLLLSNLWTAASLLPATLSQEGPWRSRLIKRLAQLFMNPRAPALLRDRAMIALVESGEKGVDLLLRQAAVHSEAHLRAGAILGLGGLEGIEDLSLIDAALSDVELPVRLAAIDALGILARMGSEPALELVVATLLEAEDTVQRRAAEILADLGEEGRAVLREGIEDQDLIVRRAAIYGLATIDEPWARRLLEEAQREDKEWLVRNAAAEALANAEDDSELSLDLALPRPEAEPWLIAWAAEQGEGTGVGEAALATLARALTEGNVQIRAHAIDTLRRVADPRTVKQLRQALRDPEPSIRHAALTALEEISRRHDLTLTAG